MLKAMAAEAMAAEAMAAVAMEGAVTVAVAMEGAVTVAMAAARQKYPDVWIQAPTITTLAQLAIMDLAFIRSQALAATHLRHLV